MNIFKIKVSDIVPNPDNPRIIRDTKFQELVQSIKEFPEMLEAREIVVNKDNMILGGNMRYNALVEAGITETTVKQVDWSVEKQREFIIKDNLEKGEWDYDILANEWDQAQLEQWGLNLPKAILDDEDEEEERTHEPAISIRFDSVVDLEQVLPEIKAIVKDYGARVSVNTD